MKKLFISTAFIVLNLFMFSQVTDNYWEKLESSAVNFTQVSDSFNIYINSTYPDSIPSDKLGNIKNYFRFVNFWKRRIGLINNETSYKPYQDAILSLLTEPICDEEDPADWELVGPVSNEQKQYLGLVTQVLCDPNNEDSYILSSDYGGMWKSQDTGNSWKNVTDALRIPGLSASELIRNPNNNNHIIASTTGGLHTANYGIGIIESFDNGDTWSVMQGFLDQNAPSPSVVKVLYDPYLSTGSEIALYAITKKELYLSLNSGLDWVLTPSPSISDFDDYVDIESTSLGILLLSTKHKHSATDGKIFRRINDVWENIKDNNSFIADFQAASFSTPYYGKIFLHCTGANGSDIYKTVNAGDTWEYLGEKFSETKNEIEYSPESNIVYHGGVYLNFFKDDGTYRVYTISSSYDMHVDIRDLEFMGIDSNGYENMLLATDGGISLCKFNFQDLDVEMYNLNGNYLPICEFLGIGISHSSPEFIIGGTMHDHSYKYENGQWILIGGGDGGDCEVNWLEPDIYYFSSNNLMGSSSNSNFSHNNTQWFEGMEYELNPNNPYILYYYYGKPSQNALLGIYNEVNDENSIKSLPVEIKQPGAIGVNSNNEIYVADFGIAYPTTTPNRFIKSLDDGDTWIDLSDSNVYKTDGTLYGDLKNVLAYKTIEDIIFNPNNPNEIWVSIGGVWTNNDIPESGQFRILHSVDAGNSWYDYSENLTAFPVMALEYQTGSNNRLFAGTDAGIYYRDPSMNQWECFSEGLPISIITDLDYDPCSKYLYASAYSRSILKTYVPFDDNTQTVISNAHEIWDSPIELANDLFIQDGAKLTITSDVYIAGGKKIIVEPGAKLIIDNGIITNRCNSPWQGIQIWGNKTAHQFPDENGNYQQGYLELKNGATIENAIVAVDLWNPDDWSSTGGIVHTIGGNSEETKVVFRNNTKSIHALHYNNYHPYTPTQEMDYNSYFKNCIFEITADYLGTETFHKHVDLAHVKGIDFQGCDFSLANNVSNVSDYTHAIAGYDAKFRVSAVCNSMQSPCPEEDYDRCTFTGFFSAINAINDGGSAVSFSVNRADFIDNAYGVRTTKVDNASVLFSNFEVGNYNGCGTGIYTDYVTGFAFEENEFSKYAGNPFSNYFGIIINSSEDVNEIYKNEFTGLSYANFSDGKNYGYNYYEGLAYYCNINSSNFADFFVADADLFNPSGIQLHQGNDDYIAANTFTTSGATWHFYNGGGHQIDYYTNPNNTNATPELIYNVEVMFTNAENTCPSHYGGTPKLELSLTTQQKVDAEQVYYDNLTDYNSTKALYDSYIDGGDTEGEKLDIVTAQPADMWALRAQLLGDSPHLSFEILKEAADKTDVFTESALFDILAANPDELRKDTLISYLENKEDPLPDYMIVLLQQLAGGITYKTALQKQMAGYKQSYYRSANDIIRSIHNDTVTDYVELRNWLNNLGGITSDRQIISTYISEGNFTDAYTLANMLPSLYQLKGNDSIEHLYYIDMLTFHQTLYQQNRNTFQLDSTEKANISYIANNSNGVAGAQAKSILEAVYNEYCAVCPDVEGTAGYKSNAIINTDVLGKIFGLDIQVKPNPAKQWAAFDYTLPDNENTGSITIRNTSGSIVEIIAVSGKQGQKLWDTRNVISGVYLYTINSAGFSKTGKIVVSK